MARGLSSARRTPRRRASAAAGALLALLAVAVIVLSARHAAVRQAAPPPAMSALLALDEQIMRSGLGWLNYRDGAWMPARYGTPAWEKYQDGAVAAAALALLPGATPVPREQAVSTVDAAIARHQLPDGDFDAGTPAAGSSGVGGGFWAESEGLIALKLSHVAPAGTVRRWERSLGRYVDYLESSGAAHWYANGNVILRQAVIMLETYELAGMVADPAAPAIWRDYLDERRYLVKPATGSAWRGYGERLGPSGALWFDESPVSAPHVSIICANGDIPCNGFDPNYSAAQLHDALVAYTVAGDRRFWLSVIRGEYAALRPRVTAGELDAGHGSRDNIPIEVFYPPVYPVLARADGGDYVQAWAQQLRAMQLALQPLRRPADPGANTYSLLMALALPLM